MYMASGIYIYMCIYIYWAGSLSNICEIQNDMAISAFKLI